jgi:hypothetical protein
MPKENTFWMSPGGAYFLGRNPKRRDGLSIRQAISVLVTKTVAVRCEFAEQMIWIGNALCAIFIDPKTQNQYAQPVKED